MGGCKAAPFEAARAVPGGTRHVRQHATDAVGEVGHGGATTTQSLYNLAGTGYRTARRCEFAVEFMWRVLSHTVIAKSLQRSFVS